MAGGNKMIPIIFAMAFELGFLPMSHFVVNNADYVFKDNSFYTEFAVSAKLYDFTAFGETRTYFWKNTEGYSFSPDNITYMAGIKYTAGPVELGFKHYCFHPVIPFTMKEYKFAYNGGYEEIYLRVEVK
jgi:hypothetical protein